MDWNQSLQAQRAGLLWFTEAHLQSVIRNGVIPEWFHGIISRKAAEELLMSKPPGYFLIRVSESRIGYTLSYRTIDRCRHFMIDALDDGQYVIVGEDRRHRCLQDLVDYHQRAPIIPFNEVLTVACGQSSSDRSDYAELLFPQSQLNPNTSLQPKDTLLQRISHQISQEDVPPALPYRPSNLSNSEALTPDSRSPQLYPALPEYPPVTTFTAMNFQPVPENRRRYIADNPSPSTQPPEVPARSSAPPPRPNKASAPESPSVPAATEDLFRANTKSDKDQEVKPSVVSEILQKKLQKRASSLQEFFNLELSRNTENEVTEEHTFTRPHFSCSGLTDGGLPQEYRLPPPFAPGYR